MSEYLSETKTCSKCNTEQHLSNYYQKPSGKGYRAECKSCQVKRSQKYQESNKEKYKDYNKKYSKEYGKTYVRKDDRKEYMRVYMKEYVKERSNTDINFRIKKNLRTRMCCAIYGGTYTKNSSLNEYLGCDWETFKQHIQSKFTEGMNWDNYGEWHIDHIKPLSLFNLSNKEELLEAGNYKNLQPLWAKDNLSKGDKY